MELIDIYAVSRRPTYVHKYGYEMKQKKIEKKTEIHIVGWRSRRQECRAPPVQRINLLQRLLNFLQKVNILQKLLNLLLLR